MNGFDIVCDAVTVYHLMQGGESKTSALAKVLGRIPEEYHARVVDYVEEIEPHYVSGPVL